MPATEPRKSEYPPRNEEKDVALIEMVSHGPLNYRKYLTQSFIPILNVPRHSAYAQHGADVGSTPIVDVPGKPQAKVVPKAYRVGADICSHHGESPEEPSEKLCGAVVPQPSDLERVPGDAAIDDLARRRHGGTDDAAHGHKYEKAYSLGPEYMPGRGRITREVGHIEGEGGFGSDGGGDALEEYYHDRGAVADVGGLREGWAESFGYCPAVSLIFQFVVLEGVVTCNEGPNEQR